MACIKPPKLLTAGQPSATVTAALFAGNPHVFDPLIKQRKRKKGPVIQGGHHLQEFDLSLVDEAVIDLATGNAIYHITLDDHGTPVEGTKSMFDQGRSRQEVRDMVTEVYQNSRHVEIKEDGRRVIEGESRGITIRLVIEADGTLVTAFPLIPGSAKHHPEGGRMQLSDEVVTRLAQQRRR